MLKKKEIDIINNFDFNFLCKILDSGDFNSSPVTRWFDNYICDSVFRIKEVHKSRFLFSLYDLLNKTLYKLDDKHFTVEKGDVLHIPKNTFHSGIGLTPRIILSFAIRN